MVYEFIKCLYIYKYAIHVCKLLDGNYVIFYNKLYYKNNIKLKQINDINKYKKKMLSRNNINSKLIQHCFTVIDNGRYGSILYFQKKNMQKLKCLLIYNNVKSNNYNIINTFFEFKKQLNINNINVFLKDVIKNNKKFSKDLLDYIEDNFNIFYNNNDYDIYVKNIL